MCSKRMNAMSDQTNILRDPTKNQLIKICVFTNYTLMSVFSSSKR